MKYITRTTQKTMLPEGESIFCVDATVITIIDEAAGEFLEIKQNTDDGERRLLVDPHEWPTLRAAIDDMIGECKEEA